jgi:predicted phage terminase large subunit-like protein
MNTRLVSEPTEKEVHRILCEDDHLFFTRYFFKHRQSIKFKVNWHHYVIAEAVERVLSGECKNLVINIPPGSSKTEMVVINLIARGLALNPRSRFLHISSGDDLVLLNSQTARDLVQSEEFQALWPMEIASDAKAKKRWNVIVDGKKAGGVYAVSLGGQITGFRAGHMVEGFSGAIIIDDPLKADDAYSPAAVKTANRQLLGTVESRKAHPNVPVIIVMQRLCEGDSTGFIKGGNMPGEWECVTVPALVTDEYIEKLPEKIRSLVVSDIRDDKGRFSYWQYKNPLNEMLALESGMGNDPDGNAISRFVFNAQYMQEPRTMGGNLITYRKIYADTAQKMAERNDYSVFECWGYGEDRKIYLLDMLRGKWEAPDLTRRAVEFWNKHSAIKENGALRKMVIEDKSSGTGLIQEIKRAHNIPIEPRERNKDKLTRVMDAVGWIESGHVCVLNDSPFLSDFITECEAFAADDSHKHDDQIDPMCDAIMDMLSSKARGFF